MSVTGSSVELVWCTSSRSSLRGGPLAITRAVALRRDAIVQQPIVASDCACVPDRQCRSGSVRVRTG